MRALQRFDVLLPAGRAWLDLPCHAPGQGLEQARALAAALPLLAALEAWCGTDLPCPEPSAAADSPADGLCLAFEPGSALAGGQLCVPWAALAPGRPPPANLAVQWPLLAARMRLQTLAVERVNAAGLVPGAVLLLPAAFSRRWAVHLQCVETAHTAHTAHIAVPRHWLTPATWLPHEEQLLWGDAAANLATVTATAPAAADPGAWSVWLVPPLHVDLRAWLGAGPTPPPPAPAAPALVELRLEAQPVAWGRLLPCGAGWALRLDRVASQQAVPAWT